MNALSATRVALIATVATCFSAMTSVDSAADTILKFDFGDTSAAGDISYSSGVLMTNDDGNAATNGDQTTSLTSQGFLDPIFADITTGASFTLANVSFEGAPVTNQFGIFQNTTGGTFQVWDDNNVLLLEGSLGSGLISGNVGVSTGGFRVDNATYTDGTLLQYVQAFPGSLSLSLDNLQSGGQTGLLIQSDVLVNFTADATGLLTATAVPEPSVFAMAGIATTLVVGRRRRAKQAAAKA